MGEWIPTAHDAGPGSGPGPGPGSGPAAVPGLGRVLDLRQAWVLGLGLARVPGQRGSVKN